MSQPSLAGTFTFPGTSHTVHRMGYGAMQLAGPHVFGPPRDRAECIAVLREAIDSGVNHIDTSDFYGPHITNQIIKEALHPYPKDLTLVTKLGARRGGDGSWIMDRTPEGLIQGVHDNLKNLGLEALDIVNLRMGAVERPAPGSIAEQVQVMVDLKKQGLIRHIGLSTVNADQLAEAQRFTPIVCIQNFYNVANRDDDAFIDSLSAQGIAYVPYFPLGGFTPLQSSELNEVATQLNSTPMQVAQAWLLQRSTNMLLIPGTSQRTHLRENLNAATLQLPPDAIATLDAIATTSR